MLNFNHLQIFHKVAALGHFTRAAEALYISQPAVSKQVHELEKTLGQPLFEHKGRQIYLTEAGRLLYDYAGRIFSLAAEAETALEELKGLERGQLTIGASMTIGTYLLPPLLGQYAAQHPAIKLSLDIANVVEIEKKLLDYQIEVGFVEGEVQNQPALVQQVWQLDELVLIDSVAQPVIKTTTEALSLAALLAANTPFILRERGSGTRAVLEQALREQGFSGWNDVLELNSFEAIKRAVSAGLGLSFVSRRAIELEEKAGLVRQLTLTDFSLTRPLYLVYVRERRLSRAAQAFLQLL